MNQRRLWIFSLLILMFIPNSVFAVPECCNNLLQSDGTQIDSFDLLSNWTLGGAGSAYGNNTISPREGTQSIYIVPANGGSGYIQKTININFSQSRNIEFWSYVDNVSNLSEVDIFLFNYTNLSTDLKFSLFPTKSGWTRRVIDLNDFVIEGDNINNIMLRLRITVYANAGKNVNVSFDDLRYNVTGKAKAIITFDDGNSTVLIAKPILDLNSQRGVSYVVTNNIGTAGEMSLSQIVSLKNAGWDVSSHTKTHPGLTSISSSQLTTELNDSFDYLSNNGFWSSAWSLAYPGGLYNNTVISAVKLRYLFARTSDTNIYQADNITIDDINTSYLLKALIISNTTTVASVNASINRTINQSGLIILLFHTITNGPTPNTYDYSDTNFAAISDYLASRSLDIDVVTLSDYLRYPNTDVVYSNNSSALVYNNISSNGYINYTYGQTYLANVQIIPSSDFVNVSITSWTSTSKIINETSANASITTQHIFSAGSFPANQLIKINRGGVLYTYVTSDSAGGLSWTYTGGYSTEFQFELTLASASASYVTSGCQNVGDWGTIGFEFLAVLLIVIAGSFAIIWLTGGSLNVMEIAKFTSVIVIVVIVGLIGVALTSPIFDLLGC